MKKPELYKITHKGEVLFENLTEEEYFTKMEELADKFYAEGTPHPLELRTEIKEN
jgi:thioredoxin-related protein